MKEKIKKILLVLLPLVFLFVFNSVEARQGCCSHHGGVCGCGCCDGTPLSATCAPYYPQCYTRPAPKYEPPVTKEPVLEEPESTPTKTITEPSTSKEGSLAQEKFTAEVSKEDNGWSIWGWIIGIGFVGYLFYNFIKRRK